MSTITARAPRPSGTACTSKLSSPTAPTARADEPSRARAIASRSQAGRASGSSAQGRRRPRTWRSCPAASSSSTAAGRASTRSLKARAQRSRRGRSTVRPVTPVPSGGLEIQLSKRTTRCGARRARWRQCRGARSSAAARTDSTSRSESPGIARAVTRPASVSGGPASSSASGPCLGARRESPWRPRVQTAASASGASPGRTPEVCSAGRTYWPPRERPRVVAHLNHARGARRAAGRAKRSPPPGRPFASRVPARARLRQHEKLKPAMGLSSQERPASPPQSQLASDVAPWAFT